MTILHLISSEGLYGAEQMLLTLAQAQRGSGIHPILAVFRDSRCAHTEVAERGRSLALEVELVRCDGRMDCQAVRAVRGLIERLQPDVVHTHGYKADVYGWLACWQRHHVLAATCHNWLGRRFSLRAYAVLDRLVLRHFDIVAAVSESVAGILTRSGVPNAAYVPNGVDAAAFQDAVPTLRREMGREFDRVVGFAGRLSPEKGADLLLYAAAIVIATRPRTAFVFAGDGPLLSELRKLAGRLGIWRQVSFTGRREDMPGVYASLDVLVLPSLEEGMPMCLLEAMAAGIPVVATRVGSVPDVVVDGVSGMVVEPNDIPALVKAILHVLDDVSGARQMAALGRRRIEQNFSGRAMAAAYQRLYEQALGREHLQRRARCVQP